MNNLRIFAWIIFIVFFLGVLVPLLWLLWGFGPNVDMSSEKNIYTYPTNYVTNEKIIEKVAIGNETNCIKIESENATTYKCER